MSNHNGLTQQSTQPVAYSAANGSANFSTITFANSNGVSFFTGTQGLYATIKTDYLTTARASNDAIGLNTAQTNLLWILNVIRWGKQLDWFQKVLELFAEAGWLLRMAVVFGIFFSIIIIIY